MKKTVFLLAIISLASAITIIACSKSKNAYRSDAFKEQQLKSAIQDDKGFPFPEGTIFTENAEDITFHLPSGSMMYGFPSAGQMVSGVSGSLTYTCGGSGGCKPFSAGGKWGCIIDGCSSCTGKTSLQGSAESELFFIRKGESSGNSALVFISDSRPIYSIEEWSQLPFADRSDVESNDFQNALAELNTYINEHFEKKNIVAIPFYFKGKKVITDVPFASVEPGMLYTLSIASGGYSCSGTCGSSKCKKDTAGMGQVVYCDGCQSGCKLTSSYSTY